MAPEFEAFAKKRADQLLKEIDDWLTPYSSPVADDFGPRVATGVHVFLFLDMSSRGEEPLSARVQGPRKLGHLDS